ncbi:hypothetical protein BB560_002303 [Smittium megazygosporum]|uniref:Glycosyltransferase family 15 protein n=1 Tax=Smittium megazygosporum TaxID=133381 RepID=A0A2T9ZF82_9FUNG|nr:hypothetical protein BB560_002303 [Smittium megazygosporum]
MIRGLRVGITQRHKSVLKILVYLLIGAIFTLYIVGNTQSTDSIIDNLRAFQNSLSDSRSNDFIKASLAPKRKNAAFVALVRNSDLKGMRDSIRQLEDRFNRKYHYPYIFLNDVPFTEEFKRGVQDLASSNVTFGTLDSESWGYPPWVDKQKAKDIWEKADYMHSKSESYRFMCRFQSGYVFRHPLVQQLDYYWRIEPDVKYFCDIDYDPFVFMAENNKKYGWIIGFSEYMATIPTLWKSTKEFIDKNPSYVAKDNALAWALNEEKVYNGCHFWSNFEIVDLSFYRSKPYLEYFEYLDKSGGFFYERWGDAPVHSLAVSFLLSKDEIHYFSDIGYYHPALGYCPDDSDKKGKCVCDPKKNTGKNFVCTKSWVDLFGKK